MIFVKLFVSFLIFTSSAEQAYAFFPKSTPVQKNFVKNIKKSNYQKALADYPNTFPDSFKNSTTGHAFYSLLMFKSGLQLNGLQNLLSLKRPRQIHPDLAKVWLQEVAVNSSLWKIVNVKISSKWSAVFPYIGNFSGFAYPHYRPKNLKALKALARKKINSLLMTDWHHYQLGLWYSIFDQPKIGLVYLDKISPASKTIDFDQVHLARGRMLYQMKKFDNAIVAYQQVSQKSDYWATALEEQAWAYTVMGKDNLSLSKLKSLFTPVLAPFAGPEPYMLTAFNQENNCDYVSSFKTISKYKQNFLPRAQALKAISTGQNTPAVRHLFKVQLYKDLNWSLSNQYINSLPSHFYNDKFLVKYFNGRARLQIEKNKIPKLSLISTIKEKLLNYSGARISYLEKKITGRLTYLAKKDLKEISNMTKKMHLIEAEVIQQLHISKNIKNASKFKRPRSKEVIVFPDDGEVWLDEIDKYSASIGLCNKKEKSL